MPEFDEKDVVRRLEVISRIEPTSRATSRAMERTRAALTNRGKSKKRE